MVNKLASMLLGMLFYRAPYLSFSSEEIEVFENIYAEAASSHSEIGYDCRFPKYRFLQYISETKPVILHGSNNKSILEFETRRQTLFNGQYVEAVFATKDGIWPVFYAVFDRSKLSGNFRNACLNVRNDKHTYYFFSLTPETKMKNPWQDGMVYLLPQEPFENVSDSIVFFDEWVSKTPVKPIAKIAVTPQDFYFINKVSRHKATESILATWFLYKLRTIVGKFTEK